MGIGDQATLYIASTVCHRHLTCVYLGAQTLFSSHQNRFTHFLVPNSFTNRKWLWRPETNNARKHQKLILIWIFNKGAQETEFLIFTFLPFHHCSFFSNCIINVWTVKCEFVCVAKQRIVGTYKKQTTRFLCTLRKSIKVIKEGGGEFVIHCGKLKNIYSIYNL